MLITPSFVITDGLDMGSFATSKEAADQDGINFGDCWMRY